MDLYSFRNKTIVITSREQYNQEGNSHMHYLDELIKSNKVIFIEPAKSWPASRKKLFVKNKNLTLFNYYNLIPYRFFPKFAGKINDIITCFLLSRKLKKESPIILWQFDPYSLEKLPFLKIFKKIYFPLDGYSRDYRDAVFAKRADLLVTVNSTFISHFYNKYSKNILLLPHGFSEVQKNPDLIKVNELILKYGKFIILTGSLSSGINFKLLSKVAQSIFPNKLVILGKNLVAKEVTEALFSQENVIYLGLKSYKEIKNYIKAASCCIVSYNKGTGTWRNPIKITDYVSHFKPTINTIPLKDLGKLEGNILYTTNDDEEFIDWVNLALDKKLPVNKSFIQEYIIKNSYENLLGIIIKKL